MKSTLNAVGARGAVASALVAGVLLVPMAMTSGAETLPAAVGEPERIHLAQAEATPEDTPVTYSPEQADRGQVRFMTDCEECHGRDLRGGLNGGPPLRGLSFEQKFADGMPASALFIYMTTQMPPGSPGRYSPSTYADLMAFILKHNGFRSGAPLSSDPDVLDYVIMEK